MGVEQWAAVDEYLGRLLLAPDPVLDQALADSRAAGLPAINVAPNQGRFLELLARIAGAREILEIGTLGGYSTIWLARALPAGGRLLSLEFEPRHAEVARGNLARAGLSEKVEVRVGSAIDTLPLLESEGRGPFDLVFIDADKPTTADYVRWAVRLAHLGTVIVVDNVVRNGGVADPTSRDADVEGVRRGLEAMAAEPRLKAAALQTVGVKGYDGLAIALVVD
ncbi:MAG TPA: O-methyltransferase [Candidatus Dormibacteraeota bacterium]|nr:O-methyltransferase [Candidatus Dormibacteraeota bacterium]